MGQVISAYGGNGLQLVVGQMSSECLSGSAACAFELVSRIIQAVCAEHGLETALVEGAVVGYKCQSGDKWLHLRPHFGKCFRLRRVFVCDAVYARVEMAVSVWYRTYQAVILVCNLAVTHNDHANAAYA